MKHSLLLTAALLTVVTAAVFGMYAAADASESPNAEESVAGFDYSLTEAVPAESTAHESDEKLLLKVFDGKLALFVGDGRYPSEIYDLLVRTLPEEDQTKLETGIEISSDEELKRLLEDFLS